MKRKSIYLLLIVAVALCASFETAVAQRNYTDQITIENQLIAKKAGITSFDMDVNLNGLNLNKNDMLIITPVLVSNESEVELEPMAVKGSLRSKVLQRPFEWKGKTHLSMPAENQVVRRNGTDQSLHYSATLPYADWQRDAQLVLRTEVVGCADCTEAQSDKLVSNKILPDKFIPNYRIPYVVPEVEEIKTRSETYSAHLNYIVGRHDLLPNFENNASELAKVDRFVQELKNNPDLTITDFTISGYASPEDTKERNLQLSQRRAETFARYMERKYGYTKNQFKVEWFGEDWDGLKKAVAASNLSNKDAIVEIIDNVPDYDARDARIIALDNGQTYNRLLREFYPPLRRNDYEISFISRPFDVEEAKELIKTKPKLLSLNEMYLVAQTYTEDSPEYKEAFDIACNTFPNAEVACINAAVGELRVDNADKALEYLQSFHNNPTVMNIVGVAYAKKGDSARAKQFFDKAIQAGNADARHNLDQMQQYIDDNM